MRSIFPPLGTHLYHPPPVSMRSPLTVWQRFEHSRVGWRHISTYLFALIILTFRKPTLGFHDNLSIDITERTFPCMMILRQIHSCQHILLRSYRCWEASCNPDNQVCSIRKHIHLWMQTELEARCADVNSATDEEKLREKREQKRHNCYTY